MTHLITDLEAAHDAVKNARGVLADWDGCLALGDELTEDSRAFARTVLDRLVIISNNSTTLPGPFSERLARRGVDLPAGRIKLAGAETIQFIAAKRSGKSVLLFSTPEMAAFAKSLDISLTQERPDVVALFRDTAFSYDSLTRITEALHHGAELIVSNIDHAHPGLDGAPVPETGALLASIRKAAKLDDARITAIGKPSPVLFERACWALKLTAEQCVMIGDNPETDGAGAAALGMNCILVGPDGVDIAELAAALARSDAQTRRAVT